MATEHRKRPPHVLRAILEGDRAALSQYGTKGNQSPRRKRKTLSPIEREDRKQAKAEEKKRQKQLLLWYLVLHLELENRRDREINAAVDAHHERSRRAQFHADARRHAKQFACVDD